jgi:RNA polymerase sigma factor (TIGR02999 family)
MGGDEDRAATARLLGLLADGGERAADELFPLVYRELHAIAHRLLDRERGGHTLQTTALLHEAWLRLAGGEAGRYEGRAHFVRVAARAMRHVLVDHARARGSRKRAGDRRVPLVEDALVCFEEDPADLLALDEALTRLGARDARMQRVVEVCFFGGLNQREAAAVLGLTERQVQHAWTIARGWLRRELERGRP